MLAAPSAQHAHDTFPRSLEKLDWYCLLLSASQPPGVKELVPAAARTMILIPT